MNSILQQPIRSLEFTVRVENCLIAENIRTVGELCAYSRGLLSRVPNLGNKAIREVEETLHAKGLSLGMKTPVGTPNTALGDLEALITRQANQQFGRSVSRITSDFVEALHELTGVDAKDRLEALLAEEPLDAALVAARSRYRAAFIEKFVSDARQWVEVSENKSEAV